jgi:hypothetical protein
MYKQGNKGIEESNKGGSDDYAQSNIAPLESGSPDGGSGIDSLISAPPSPSFSDSAPAYIGGDALAPSPAPSGLAAIAPPPPADKNLINSNQDAADAAFGNSGTPYLAGQANPNLAPASGLASIKPPNPVSGDHSRGGGNSLGRSNQTGIASEYPTDATLWPQNPLYSNRAY